MIVYTNSSADYWLVTVVLSLLFATIATCVIPRTGLTLCTAVVGAYVFALSVVGLVPLLGAPPLPIVAFFLIFFAAALVRASCSKIDHARADGQAAPASHSMFVSMTLRDAHVCVPN